ncbi:hypothetical protein F5Y15DRAFT_365558 [Xylariaceae sp. FL0016]|nr:hypothetical protein F5Y15DRAFT_365558 [Xylariaceae sp. FL0016]
MVSLRIPFFVSVFTVTAHSHHSCRTNRHVHCIGACAFSRNQAGEHIQRHTLERPARETGRDGVLERPTLAYILL